MSYKIVIRPLALQEILDAFDWYESQKAGLGFEFIQTLDEFYTSLQNNPYAYSFYKNSIRQGKLHRFPYLVVYELFGDTIVIFSVFMQKRNPSEKRRG